MTDTINEARALLAHWRGIGWSDDGSAPAYTTVAALVADLEAARADLAAARAAMPTAEVIVTVRDSLRAYLRSLPECSSQHVSWAVAHLQINRLDAYHAAHPAESPAAEVPKLCTACQGDGMGPYDRQPYYPGSRAGVAMSERDTLPPAPRTKRGRVCPHCHSPDVDVMHWVGLNTLRVSGDSLGDDCHCNDCESEFRYGDTLEADIPIPPPSMVSDEWADGVRFAIDTVLAHPVDPEPPATVLEGIAESLCEALRDAGHEP